MRSSTLYSFMRPNTTSQAGDSAQRPARRRGQCVQAQTRGQPRLPSLLHCTRTWLPCAPELPYLALCARWHRPVAPAQAPCVVSPGRCLVGRRDHTVQAQTRGQPRLPSLLHCTRTWLLCAPELPCLALCARWHRPVAPAQAPCGLAGALSRRPARPHTVCNAPSNACPCSYPASRCKCTPSRCHLAPARLLWGAPLSMAKLVRWSAIGGHGREYFELVMSLV